MTQQQEYHETPARTVRQTLDLGTGQPPIVVMCGSIRNRLRRGLAGKPITYLEPAGS